MSDKERKKMLNKLNPFSVDPRLREQPEYRTFLVRSFALYGLD